MENPDKMWRSHGCLGEERWTRWQRFTIHYIPLRLLHLLGQILNRNHQAEGLEKPSGERPCVTANTAEGTLLMPSTHWQWMYLLLTSALYRDLWCCPACPGAATRVWDPNPTFCKAYKTSTYFHCEGETRGQPMSALPCLHRGGQAAELAADLLLLIKNNPLG